MEICKPVLPEVVYLVYIVLAKYSLGVISWLIPHLGGWRLRVIPPRNSIPIV